MNSNTPIVAPIKFSNATKWMLNGQVHREDGPAIEFKSGRKDWFLYGRRHREDGPAVVYPNGEK